MNIYETTTLISEKYGLRPRKEWSRSYDHAIKDLCSYYKIKEPKLGELALKDPEVFKKMADYFTVQESHFFRDLPQLTLLASRVQSILNQLPDYTKVTVWSAGCARGEEPYSLAMILSDNLTASQRERVVILGNDMCEEAIGQAQEGVFHSWALRSLGTEKRDRYFTQLPKNRYSIKEKYRKMVTFNHAPILESVNKFHPESIDFVLFRNVAIYLEGNYLEEFYLRVAKVLKPKGLMVLSKTDPLLNVEGIFETIDGHLSIYELKNEVEKQPLSPSNGAVNEINYEYEKLSLEQDANLDKKSHYLSSDSNSSGLAEECLNFEVVDSRIKDALTAGNAGGVHNALKIIDSFIFDNPYDSEAYLLRGQIYLAVGQTDKAVKDLRQAVFLSPGFLASRYWYALALKKTGSIKRAMIQCNALLSDLTELNPDYCLRDGKTTAGELLSAAAKMKEELHV